MGRRVRKKVHYKVLTRVAHSMGMQGGISPSVLARAIEQKMDWPLRGKYETIERYVAEGHAPLVKKARTPEKRPWVPTFAGDVNGDAFLSSYEWRRIRLVVLKRDGRRCACCGASPETGAVMHVDHIKPRKLFPHLALDPDNLQVLCAACNHGKGNWDMTDFRAPVIPETEMTEEQCEHMRAILMHD